MDETPFGDDTLHEECGVFGIFERADAAAVVTLGLHALQHRGQEAAGIVSHAGAREAPGGARLGGGRALKTAGE